MINTRIRFYNVGGYIILRGCCREDVLRKAIQLSSHQFTGESPGSQSSHQDQFRLSTYDFTNSPQPRVEARRWMELRFHEAFNMVAEDPLFEICLLTIEVEERWIFVRFHRSLLDNLRLIDFCNNLGKIYQDILVNSSGDLAQVSMATGNDASGEFNQQDYPRYPFISREKSSVNQVMVEQVPPANYPENIEHHHLVLLPHQQVLVKEIKDLLNVSLDLLALAATAIYFDQVCKGSVGNAEIERIEEPDPSHPGSLHPEKHASHKTIKDFLEDIRRHGGIEPFHSEAFEEGVSKLLQSQQDESGRKIQEEANLVQLNFGPPLKAYCRLFSREREDELPCLCWFEDSGDEGLSLKVQAGDSFSIKSTADLFARRILYITGQMHPAVNNTLEHIQIIPPEELMLIDGFSHSSVVYPQSATIVDLFEEQAVINATAVAVVFGAINLSYKEVNDRSNQLAHYLVTKGITDQSLVPVCMERSAEMILTILAVLKVGAAYVPIDPAYPAGRIQYMLEDTKATVLLTNTAVDSFVPGENVQVINVVKHDAAIGQCSMVNLGKQILPDQLVYVIYTSGSTGRPKGVMIEHGALLDHCFGLIQVADLESCRSFALFSPLVFDAGHSIIHTAFILGASLHVLSNTLLADGETLKTYFDANPVDCLKIVPSLWLSYAEGEQMVLARKTMIFGGETFSQKILSLLAGVNYCGAVYNHYGPTETTIGKCIHLVNLNENDSQVPIGRPFSNTRICIVDNQNKIQPIGLPGELLIAGRGLARGYLNHPELTSEKFVPDSFRQEPGAKMYRTGDLVKWLPGGKIEYLGRKDEQVKIRGYRIETGEIEMVLQESKLVHHAVVLVNTGEQGTPRLVAYVVPASDFSLLGAQTYLKQRLPDYMIPAVWMQIDRMPLTINGKLDRKALSELDIPSAPGNAYTPPETVMEVKLAQIWQRLLGYERVGRQDNFWELGGHSLLAMRMVSAVRKQLEIEFELQVLFEYPSLELLSNYLETTTPVSTNDQVMPAGKSSLPLLSFGQQSLWFIDQAGGSLEYHLPFSWNIKGNIAKSILVTAFQEIIERHIPLRTVVKEIDGAGYPHLLPARNWTLSLLRAGRKISAVRGRSTRD